VYLGGDIAGPGGIIGSVGSIHQFDRQGQHVHVFGESRDGPYTRLAVHGNTIYAWSPFHSIKRFSQDGAFLGYLAAGVVGSDLTLGLETDSRGSIYAWTDGQRARRLNADGSVTQTFSNGPDITLAVDSDKHGNVYIDGASLGYVDRGIHKYDSEGRFLGVLPRTVLNAYAPQMVIDEDNEIMYLNTSSGSAHGLDAYDISGPLPLFVRSISTPDAVGGLFFEPATGHLFMTEYDGQRAWELTTEGATVERYRVNSDEGTFFHFDVVAITVPEPASLVMLGLGTLTVFIGRRHSQERSRT
jgi:hypothetical protein